MKKGFLIAAIILIIIGGALFTYALVSVSLDFSRLGTQTYATSDYSVEGAFTKIEIDETETDVFLTRSEDGTCKVLIDECEKVRHTVAVEDGTLKIAVEDARSWLDHLTLWSKNRSMIVYLSSDVYESLAVKNHTGDVSISVPFNFENLTVSVSTGKIEIGGASAEKIALSSTTGRIALGKTTCDG